MAGGIATQNGLRFSSEESNAPAGEITGLLDGRKWDLSVGWIGEQDGWFVDDFYYVSGHRLVRWRKLQFGLGLMARERVDGIENTLPQWWNFSFLVGVNLGNFSLELRHASNAGLEDPNRGQNWLLAGWRFGVKGNGGRSGTTARVFQEPSQGVH